MAVASNRADAQPIAADDPQASVAAPSTRRFDSAGGWPVAQRQSDLPPMRQAWLPCGAVTRRGRAPGARFRPEAIDDQEARRRAVASAAGEVPA